MSKLANQQWVIVLLLGAAVVAFNKTRRIDYERHAQVVAQISELKQLNATLEENILKARIGLLSHYDPVVATIQRLKHIHVQFIQSTIDDQESAAIEEPALGYTNMLRQQEQLIERFKSENAILKNSLTYFPTAVDRLRRSAAHSPGGPALVDTLNALAENVLVYSLHGDDFRRRQLRVNATTLEAMRGDVPDEIRTELDYCLAHARRIDEFGERIAQQLHDILHIPAGRTIEAMFAAHNTHYEAAVREANFYRLGLYVLCIVLVAYSAWMLIALRRTAGELNVLNATLEERIEQRTKELRDKNQDLVHSRRQIEDARNRIEESHSSLAEANTMLARKNAELDEFSYVASHDLQEPLRKLISFSNLLELDAGGDLNDKARKDLHFITDAAARMKQLVQDLLQLSRAGRSAMKRELVDLDDCAASALHALSMVIEETDAQICREPLPCVCGDSTMLTQLYQNLISNALKFRVSDRQPVIQLTAERYTDGWRLGVRDNGIGIKPEHYEQIFAAFKRLHNRGDYEGTGIGLAICRKTVERHGGLLEVTSEPGEGAHFSFTIPNTNEDISCLTEAKETSFSSSMTIPATRS